MAVYPQFKYDPRIHSKPWLEKYNDMWWRIRSVNYLTTSGLNPGERYHDIAYSDNPEELILWADLNGVPIAKPQKL